MTHDDTPDDAAAAMKVRLRADLRLALTSGRGDEARVVRDLIAALDNAAAAPLRRGRPSAMRHDFRSGSAEVERLWLDAARVRVLLLEEISKREEAAAAFERVGRPEAAAAATADAALVRRYLGD